MSLAVQFLVAGGAVLLAAMFLAGYWVTSRIEDGVTSNAATTTALYVDSVIAPILPDMRRSEALGESVKRALDETLDQGGLGDRIVLFRLWSRDGTILYSKDAGQIGKTFPLTPNLEAAWSGRVVARFDKADESEKGLGEAAGLPLMAIYNPVREPWSGQVVAVSEFYEIAHEFRATLSAARISSWLFVAGTTLAIFGLLWGIVYRGSRTIDDQRQALQERVSELQRLLAQNSALRLRVQGASRRAAALNERYLRRIAADLHDGPAQLLALASLRMDSRAISSPRARAVEREAEVGAIKASLDEAMREIRDICNGLVLPQIETANLAEILGLAVATHEQRTGTAVALSGDVPELGLASSEKISIFRFVQEALNNAFRHAGGQGQAVKVAAVDGRLVVEVIDEGAGFDVENVRADRLGLAGLRERVESIGGDFSLASSPQGTRVAVTLAVREKEQT
ncbi:sensor histidine kinase [Mesorhizobium sp. CC13]|uniref:sensor histidine kinase n=1 Tax=Mesorhizobium sp. CC13 TaxID=3029194 RepID=UPI003263D102